MTFNTGDPVVHWTYGFGHVVGKEERVIAGRKTLYYAILTRELTVWVPVDSLLDTRLRPPTSLDGFKNLFAILTGKGEPLPENRQERKVMLLERLKDGRAASLCQVLRNLATYQQAHALNEVDMGLMKRSRESLLGEWCHAFSITAVEAEAELQRMLEAGYPGRSKR